MRILANDGVSQTGIDALEKDGPQKWLKNNSLVSLMKIKLPAY